MARFVNPTPEQEKGWAEWVAARPDGVRQIAERFEPWSLYLLKTTGQRVTLASIFEDGTVSVNVSGEFNFLMMDRNVFGINPDDLEPCDLPNENEITGTLMSDEQVEENINTLRVMVRPDLWEMGADGKARRKDS